MKVRLLKDWSWHKAGDTAEVFDPTARNWIATGIAEPAKDARSAPADRAVVEDGLAENAAVAFKRNTARKP